MSSERKRLAILGATGSIGTQCLDVVRQHPDRLQVVAMAAHRQESALMALAHEFGVEHLALAGPSDHLPHGIPALVELATRDDVDCVVVAVAGAAAFLPTVSAIEAGKDIALATKEVLVAAGEWVMPLVQKHGVTMTPIDSEHSAIFQCLAGYRSAQIRSLLLTASGGPFRGRTRESLAAVTREEALRHPTWTMGGKITIDSATLMNKALEMVEAKWLFGVSMDQVDVVVHPQSVIHSLVEFHDGSMLGQLGWPNMRLPIQVALLWPERVESGLEPWNPVRTPNLTFEAVDHETFPALRLVREAERLGGTAPCIFNAANEAAVAYFLEGRISFLGIAETVARCLEAIRPEPVCLEAILHADSSARSWVRDHVGHA